MSALGLPEFIGELILAHDIRSDVAKHYAHHGFEAEMRAGLERWSDKLCTLRGRPRGFAKPPSPFAKSARAPV